MYERYPDENGDEVVLVNIDAGNEQSATEKIGRGDYRGLRLSIDDGEVINNGTDTETITVEVVDRLELLSNQRLTVLPVDCDVTLSIDGVQTTKTLSNGSVSFDLTTEKSAGSIIEIVAESLADYPAESGSATIEVINA